MNDSADPPTDAGGTDPAEQAFESMRAMSRGAAGAGHRQGAPRKRRRRGVAGQRRHWSSSGADERDPQKIGNIFTSLARDSGWSSDITRGQVFGNWDGLVGPEIAQRITPISLTDGELTVEAESTAWATQVRLLSRRIIESINKQVGPGVVKTIKVRGPAAPSWKRGLRTVRGRGPRDTYG